MHLETRRGYIELNILQKLRQAARDLIYYNLTRYKVAKAV